MKDTRKRPLSLAIIGWVLCFGGGITLLSLWLLKELNPYPSVGMAMTIAGARTVFLVLCGVFILRGRDWSRLFFLWGAPLLFGVDVFLVGLNWVDAIRVGLYAYAFVQLTKSKTKQYMKGETK